MTVYAKRKRIAAPKSSKPAIAAARAPPKTNRADVPARSEGAAPNGGPPVIQTTAGPVSGYRALTSVSATRTDTLIERIPQAIAVVPRAVLDDQQPLGLMDGLRNISAVTPMSGNTFLGYAYKVRGFPADRYVDGLPNYYDGGDNTSLVNTERIEVLKGPAGILYQGGIGPVGGIINTVSKLPTENRFAEIGATAGGYGLWNGWFDVNQPIASAGTALFRMTGDVETSGDFVDAIDHRRYALNPTFLFNDNDGTRLTIQGSFSSRSFQNYTGLPGAGTVDRSQFTISPTPFPDRADLGRSWTTYNGVTLRVDHAFDAVWSANATTRVSQMRLEQFGHFLGTDTPLYGSIFPFLSFHLPVDTREVAANANVLAKFAVGPTWNTVLFGADSDHVADKIRDDVAFAGLVDFANPVFPAYTPPTTSAFNADNLYVNSGFTTQWQSDICERLHLLAGVRLAHVYIHGTDMVAGSDFVTNAWKPLPRLGAVVDLVKGVSAFADYSQGYRGVPFFNAAGAPKPEEAEQTEAGLKLALPSGFAGTLAWFTNTRRNVMSLLPGSIFLATQVGEQRAEGFDADLTWQPFGGLSILASYAHVRAVVTRDQLYVPGTVIDRVPRDSGRLWANYKFQHGWLQNVAIGAGLYAASAQAVALDNIYFTPGYVTFDGKVAYERDRWSIGVTGKNLADRRYFVPYASGSGYIMPAEGRTILAFGKLIY
ncbi:TonB-dependent siderophore receptor [Bradyrhizobium diazoefficiens]|uniref:TonB-dependent siderophore receptor n=1 Tax=Bradyrhizobium diazoefficiens TaxID=1355477 RepID=UPI00190C8F63|nr:TonB-dependent siderophore receptor [Bradyrhizobium diazoefficiens]MBK3664669.1 TonB-dependent siderophore receptor [Bradyrhizobium diazoefficiens]